MMNDKKIDNPVFSYAKESSTRNCSLVRSSVAGGIFFGVWMGLFNAVLPFFISDVQDINIIASVAGGIAGGSLFGIFTYLSLSYWVGRLKKNQSGDFIAPMPAKFGKVLACIGSNHQQNKIAIGGQLYICELGLCFCPHKFNWPKPNVLEAFWSDIQCVYKSSGTRQISELFSGGRRDRLAFEINNKDHFFVVDNLDKLIEDINIVYQKDRNQS